MTLARRRVLPCLAILLLSCPAAGDPRQSLEERYGTLDAYVCAVRRATEELVRDRYLFADDAERLVREAAKTAPLPSAAEAGSEARRVAERVCR